MTGETMTDEGKFIGLYDDRFEIIARARKHIIEATNIEMSPEEMKVLDNFLFRCWQIGWLKNDFHKLEKENEQLKKENKICEEIIIGEQQEIKELRKENAELKAQVKELQKCEDCSHRNDLGLCGMDCHNKDNWEKRK